MIYSDLFLQRLSKFFCVLIGQTPKPPLWPCKWVTDHH